MKMEPHWIEDDDGRSIAQVVPVTSIDIAVDVIRSDMNSPNGRSPWVWVRLSNGDLLLGVFPPQGDTYFNTALAVEIP